MFSTCCAKGNLSIDIDQEFPDVIKQLCYNKTFLRLSRDYNNKLAFASFTTKLITLKGQGPQTVRICGQVYHNVSSLHPEDEQARQYGQLYILDNAMATRNRTSDDNALSIKVMSILDELIRNKNPYAQSYKMMSEVEHDEIIRSEIPRRDIKMILTRDPCKDKNRYNIAACNEVAVVFVSKISQKILYRFVPNSRGS